MTISSQVVTEYFRDYEFEDGALDGVAYRSTVHRRGWNVALFLGPEDLGLANREWGVTPTPAFEFENRFGQLPLRRYAGTQGR